MEKLKQTELENIYGGNVLGVMFLWFSYHWIKSYLRKRGIDIFKPKWR